MTENQKKWRQLLNNIFYGIGIIITVIVVIIISTR
jgi:hypothetical protein